MKKRKKATSSVTRTARTGRQRSPKRAVGTARVAIATAPEIVPTVTDAPVPNSTEAANPAPVGPTSLCLAAEWLVSDASSLKQSLNGLLEQPLPVTLDVSALQRIDTAGLQLITAFVQERARQGRSVEWHGSAPVLSSAAQLLGLTSLLRLPA